MDGIAVNEPMIVNDCLNPSQRSKFLVKISEKYFQMDNVIDRRGYRSFFFAWDCFKISK